MIRQNVQKILRHFVAQKEPPALIKEPAPVDPAWPLPRRPGGLSDEEIRKAFAKYDLWHYAYEFDGGLSFSAHHNEAQNGSLQGKRVLDIACNSGFWSIQCALLGADVVGFDARVELIEQANLVKSIVGINRVKFKLLDFWNMSPRLLDGTFDIVLNLGILYIYPSLLKHWS
jgi:2-polyprenyl-3-methyl-5-hydroxy-6-metoxy-1,4-benzoquinol methylase